MRRFGHINFGSALLGNFLDLEHVLIRGVTIERQEHDSGRGGGEQILGDLTRSVFRARPGRQCIPAWGQPRSIIEAYKGSLSSVLPGSGGGGPRTTPFMEQSDFATSCCHR